MRNTTSLVRVVTLFALAAGMTGCGARTGRVESGEPDADPDRVYAHEAEYHVTCSSRSECRIQFTDSGGTVREATAVGEWTHRIGVDPGARLWLRASAGGCPASPIRVAIAVDGTQRADQLEEPTGAAQCQWVTAEAESSAP